MELININFINPFNYSNYNFITENSSDIKDSWIYYAEKEIKRAENQIKLISIFNDVDIGLKIELSIFEYALIYCQNNKYNTKLIKPIYEDKFDTIIRNIVDTPGINNYTLKKNLIEKIINPSCVAFLPPSQIHPAKWQYFINKKEYIEERKNNISYSDIYKCYKCGESKCKIIQAQTRSADEPMTTFVTCLVCHNTFKFC